MSEITTIPTASSPPDAETSDVATAVQPVFTPPAPGELITSEATRNTYKIGSLIGEGNFGYVFECTDTWENELAVKILKPKGSYEQIRDSAILEYQKLRHLRHPNITYVYDAF